MKTLRFLLGDHLTRDAAALADLDADRDVVALAEVDEETVHVPHHRQKIAFFLAAMRAFARALDVEGVTVDYLRLDAADNPGTLVGALRRAVARHRPDRVVMTEPGEWRVLAALRAAEATLGVPLEIRDDDRFYLSRGDFARWAGERRTLRLEHFYRFMRRRTGILMDGATPAGGAWNFDRDNRKPLPAAIDPPEPPVFPVDDETRAVLDLVARRFPDGFGDLEPFRWAVTRAGAQAALQRFVAERLAHFGDYQDAMRRGAPFVYHAVLSPYLNVGLLTAREVVAAAEAAYRAGRAPINAVEGFVRQILGWREYVRGLYWQEMPGWAERNALAAERPLPWFYWSGETDMACLAESIGEIRRNAYGHHIQRLMVTGNFALLAGLRPKEVAAWYLSVYADAVEWVELPNVMGMALHADGGLMASKPYAASGAYIDRMSDYCAGCRYDPGQATGEGACPFNALYWAFLMRNEGRLRANPRMALAYRTLDRFPAERRAALLARAGQILAGLDGPPQPAPRQLSLDV